MVGQFFLVTATWSLCGIFGIVTYALQPEIMLARGLRSAAVMLTSHVMAELTLGWFLLFLGSRIALTMAKYGDSYSQLPTAADPETEVVKNEGYAVFGARFSQPFLATWEAYLTVSNLSDENCEPESGYPAQGRTFWLGVSYKY